MFKNVLVLTDHFTRYAMACTAGIQRAKAVTHILYEWLMAVFGMPTNLMGDHGVNSTSPLVEELTSAFGIQKCGTTVYHTQCNGQVERSHQTLFRMIRRLAADYKAQWEHHLPKLTWAYNSTRSAIMGYSPHYLIFGDILDSLWIFSTIGTDMHHRWVPAYVEEVQKWFKVAHTEGVECCWSPSRSASNAPPCSPEILDHVTWSNPDSRMLEYMIWSVHDGILTLLPMQKLVSSESYTQVTRHLATKPFWGLQVCCHVRISAQFDELSPPKLQSVVWKF